MDPDSLFMTVSSSGPSEPFKVAINGLFQLKLCKSIGDRLVNTVVPLARATLEFTNPSFKWGAPQVYPEAGYYYPPVKPRISFYYSIIDRASDEQGCKARISQSWIPGEYSSGDVVARIKQVRDFEVTQSGSL